MTEFKRWGDEKPELNKLFIMWEQGDVSPAFCRCQDDGSVEYDRRSLGAWSPEVDSRWCYAPAPPDWSEALSGTEQLDLSVPRVWASRPRAEGHWCWVDGKWYRFWASPIRTGDIFVGGNQPEPTVDPTKMGVLKTCSEVDW